MPNGLRDIQRSSLSEYWKLKIGQFWSFTLGLTICFFLVNDWLDYLFFIIVVAVIIFVVEPFTKKMWGYVNGRRT